MFPGRFLQPRPATFWFGTVSRAPGAKHRIFLLLHFGDEEARGESLLGLAPSQRSAALGEGHRAAATGKRVRFLSIYFMRNGPDWRWSGREEKDLLVCIFSFFVFKNKIGFLWVRGMAKKLQLSDKRGRVSSFGFGMGESPF